MAKIKKACKGVSYPKSSSVSGRLGSPSKKAKTGTSLGMKSVKAGFDKNPGVTRADIIVAAKGKAKKGMRIKKAQQGDILPENLPPKIQTSGKTKTKTYSDRKGEGARKDYVVINKSKVGPEGKSVVSKSKLRRTVGGFFTGAPKPHKNGGKTKKCMYGCK